MKGRSPDDSIRVALYLAFIQNLPGPIGYRLRYGYYKRRLRHLGEDVRIDVNVFIERPEYVSIQGRCAIDRGTMILSGPDRTSRHKTVIPNPAYDGEPGEVHIGRGVHISSYCIVSGRGGVSIGDECGLASKSTIHSFSHHYRSNASRADDSICMTPLVDWERQALIVGPVVVGANVGVALNAAILPGATVERNSLVTANTVVAPGTRYPPNSIIGGQPTRRLAPRFV
jgi:acetyltransferase-like isoleucine patch superfamily enzyme